MGHISEYEVETRFIDRLESIGYKYIELKNYTDVLGNFRAQLSAFNSKKLIEVKGTADLSDAVAKAGKCRGATSSLPSEEDDSGLCGPPAEREEKQRLFPGDPSQIRSLSSVEDAHTTEQYRPFFSVNSIKSL